MNLPVRRLVDVEEDLRIERMAAMRLRKNLADAYSDSDRLKAQIRNLKARNRRLKNAVRALLDQENRHDMA